jgi:hypothetical protein
LEKRVCGCEKGFYNSTSALRVCFHGSYDLERVQTAIDEHSSRKTQEQDCGACPADIVDDSCLTCEDGVATVSPGFTMPPLTSARRMLTEGHAELQTLFRCHLEMDLAIKRCPGCSSPPCACAEGYSGNVCNECMDGYGMSSSTRTCELCEGTGYTGESMLLLAGILAAVALVTFILLKIWKNFPLKHLLRCAFQPARILITYSQITVRVRRWRLSALALFIVYIHVYIHSSSYVTFSMLL